MSLTTLRVAIGMWPMGQGHRTAIALWQMGAGIGAFIVPRFLGNPERR
jgi:hypothetical protein